MSATESAYYVPQELTAASNVVETLMDDNWLFIGQFLSTVHTQSPWGAGDLQHGSPPAALVAHALEAVAAQQQLQGGRFSRMTVEILGAVPLSELLVLGRVVRPGKRITLIETLITDTSGREFVRGSGWWIATTDTTEEQRSVGSPIVPVEEAGSALEFTDFWRSGYIDSIEVKKARRLHLPGGVADRANQFAHWSRSPLPVVLGKTDSVWERVMKTVDISNGLNQILDTDHWMWMNVDLTVYLHRLPEGEWLGHVAEANFGPDGIGTTVTELHDAQGPIGTANQGIILTRLG